MFVIKTITEQDGSILFEVNRMYSLDNHTPLKTFTNQQDAHNYVISLIEEFKNSLNKGLSAN